MKPSKVGSVRVRTRAPTPCKTPLCSRRKSAQVGPVIDLIGRTKTMDMMPLVKVVVPTFIQSDLPASSTKEAISNETLERLGAVAPEDITRLLNDNKLMQELSESRAIRKSLERKRLIQTNDPTAIFAQAGLVAESKLSETERSIAEGTWRYKSKGYKPLSTITTLVKSKRHPIAKKSGNNLTKFNTVSNEQDTARLKNYIKTKNSRLHKVLNPPQILVEKRIPGRTQSCSLAYLNRSRSRTANCTPDKYAIGGFDQFCTAADGMCNAFINGKGMEELLKYRKHFGEFLRPKPLPSQHTAAKIQVVRAKEHIKELEARTQKLGDELEKRCKYIAKWLGS